MRKLITLIVLLVASMNLNAQSIIGKMYNIVPDYVNVYGVDSNNHIIPTAKFRASSNTKFTVTGFDSSHNIKITFWRYHFFTDSSKETMAEKAKKTSEYYAKIKSKTELYKFDDISGYIGRWANYKEFAMKPEDFNSSCIPYFGSNNEFTWGVMTLPIKLRPGNSTDRLFSYEEKLNLGFVFGLRHQLQGKVQQSLNYLVGVGIANVRTDSLSQKSGVTPSGTSSAAFSANIGALYAYGNFQLGVFVGTDHIPGTLGRDWKYQGKPWI